MRVHLQSLGCRLNEAELETWSRQFQSRGYQLGDADNADVLVLNTCAVTAEAVRKSRQNLRRLRRSNPLAKLVITGCYASLDEAQPDELAEHGVDLLVHNRDKRDLVERVFQLDAALMPQAATRDNSVFTRSRQRAFIKIQDGCRYRCAFCIVTVARGDEVSRPVAEIIDEINALAEQGVREVVLTGVHVGGYGGDIGASLLQLVQAVLHDTDIERIRFASVEPWDLPDGFWALFSNPRLMPHVHLPLQSGADSVLRRMSRRTRRADFSQLMEQAQRYIPGFNATTDLIVGFPGETDDEFAQTLEFTEAMGFGHLHIFSYSRRAGTKAERLPDQISKAVKSQRSRALHDLGQRLKHQFLARQDGRNVPVLWERIEVDAQGQRIAKGYTPNYARVHCPVPHTTTTLQENHIDTVTLRAIAHADHLQAHL